MSAVAMRHDLFVYDADDGFAEHIVPFLAEGVAGGEPVIAVTDERLRTLLQDTLGRDFEHVTYFDRDQFYSRPESVLAASDATVRSLIAGGAASARVYGELPLFDDPGEWRAWHRYEAVVNGAFAGQPVWLRCGYDARVVPAEAIETAWRTHEHVLADVWHESPHYRDAASAARALTPAPEPVGDLRELPLTTAPRAFRALLRGELAAAGLTAAAADELVAAAVEILANAERHGGGLRSIRAGRSGDAFVCELADAGHGFDDPLAGWVPPRGGPDHAGLWAARQLTSKLDLVSSPAGLTVRLWK